MTDKPKRIRRKPEGHKSAASQAQREQAPVKHGMYVLERHGESALSKTGRSRLQELQELFRSAPGRAEYREQLAAFMALMVEMGKSHIQEQAEGGGDIWTSSPVSRLPTYVNGLIKLMDNWPKDDNSMDITDILSGKVRDAE